MDEKIDTCGISIVTCSECKWARRNLDESEIVCCYYLYHRVGDSLLDVTIPVEKEHFCSYGDRNGVSNGEEER